MSWKPEVLVEGKWSANALVFATQAEAKDYAQDLFMRWTLTEDHRAVKSDLPVNYSYKDYQLTPVKEQEA